MDNHTEPSREDLEAMVRKAHNELLERLAQMTPEELEQVQRRFEQAAAQDKAEMERIIADAKSVSAPEKAPKFCPNCGAAADGGKFCASCGTKLHD